MESSPPLFVTPASRHVNLHSSIQDRELGAQPFPESRSNGTTQLEPEDDDEIVDDTLHEVIMAINVRERGTVGCAYYIARDEKLLCMEDMRLGGAEAVQARELFL